MKHLFKTSLAFAVTAAVLAGCGTTPGVGVPTVLLSGKLAAARITGGPRRPRLPLTPTQEASV